MNLQPSEFIASATHKGSPHTTWSPALSYASGTASSCLSMPQRGLTGGYSSRKDPNNLPVILFDPLDTDTDTDKENNNDNDTD